MKSIINNHKKDWIERMDMKSDTYFCQKWIDKLDTIMTASEAKWGVGVLENLVAPELSQKWKMQCEKINNAIIENDTFSLPELVAGAQRGLEALERDAIARGHKPHHAPHAWTVAMPCGKTLAIVATHDDAAKLHGKNQNVVVWTLSEIANIISKQYVLVNVLEKKEAAKIERKPEIDWNQGEAVPF